MKTKFLSYLLLAIGFACVMPAVADSGNIGDILPCDEFGFLKTYTEPLIPGQTAYFKLRLVSTPEMYANGEEWVYQAPAEWAESIFPMKVGLAISGTVREATFVGVFDPLGCKNDGVQTVRDFIFGYTVQQGDFARPIRLAYRDGSAVGRGGDDAELWIVHGGTINCDIVNSKTSNPANLTIGDVFEAPVKNPDGSDSAWDYNAAKAFPTKTNFWVQTINFDNELDGTYWRRVEEGSTLTATVDPSLVAEGPLAAAATLYVWSTNESAVTFPDDDPNVQEISNFKSQNGTTISKKVLELNFATGTTAKSFKIKGVTAGTTAKLVLSAYNGYTFAEGTSTVLVDTVETAEILVTKAEPKVTVLLGAESGEATGTSPYKSAATLRVELSKAYTQDVTVQFELGFDDGTSAFTADDYVKFGTTENTNQENDLVSINTFTLTVPAGETRSAACYLYALRSDEHTCGLSRLCVTPKVTAPADAKTFFGNRYTADTIEITAPPAKLSLAPSDQSIAVVRGADVPLKVKISDVYADLMDTTRAGYTLLFRANPEAAVTTLTGLFVQNGELKQKVTKEGVETYVYPVVTYETEGAAQTSTIQVISPISGVMSETLTFTANVTDSRKVAITFTDGKAQYNEQLESDKGFGNEGLVNFEITLSETYGKPLYAFLKPTAKNITTDMFEYCVDGDDFILATAASGMAADGVTPLTVEQVNEGKIGIPIDAFTGYAGKGENKDGRDPILGAFYVVQGTQAGLSIPFQVELRDDATYKKGQPVAIYQPEAAKIIKVKNVKPSVDTMKVGAATVPAETDAAGVHDYKMQLPVAQNQTFSITIDDTSYDLAHGMKYRWSAEMVENNSVQMSMTDADGNSIDSKEITLKDGAINPDDLTFMANFQIAGDWLLKVEVVDNDIGTKNWGAGGVFVTKLHVIDQPAIQIDAPTVIDETDKTQQVKFTLPFYAVTGANAYLAAKVKVTLPTKKGANGKDVTDGNLVLKPAIPIVTPQGAETLYPPTALETGEQYIYFTSAGQTLTFNITDLDGTALTGSEGVTISAEVLGDQKGPAWTPDATTYAGKTWDQYYLSMPAQVLVNNVVPTMSMLPDENTSTNAWSVAKSLNFTIGSDVAKDLAAGLTVTIGGDVKSATVITDANPNGEVMTTWQVTSANQAFKVKPDFGESTGDKLVLTLTIEDKDGGSLFRSYYYNVKSARFLYTRASGPAGAYAGSTISGYYHNLNKARGLGQGYVYANESAAPNSGGGFDYRWDCSGVEANVTAMGFKAGVPKTTYMTSDGGMTTATAGGNFTYNDTTRDSFFYAWLLHNRAENGTVETVSYGIVPEQAGATAAGEVTLKLAEEPIDGKYLSTRAEAIFSKELYALDNCGDINQDGIPDLMVIGYWPTTVANGVVDLESDLSANNEDEDFLPAGESSGNSIMPHAGDQWAQRGQAFNAYREIRGWGVGLNAGYKTQRVNDNGTPDDSRDDYVEWVAPDPDYSPNEKRAYLLWRYEGETLEETEITVEALRDFTLVEKLFNEPTIFEQARKDLSIANDPNTENANNGDLDKGWSPERPTDPTKPDFDNDGIPDGYEYWFWYAAKVGYNDGNGDWQGPLTGRKLNRSNLLDRSIDPADPDDPTRISPTQICAAFDPRVGAGGEDNDANRENFLRRDLDGDGLTDIEEVLMGTNPLDFDTDGGGAPDGYEVIWGLNPLSPPPPDRDDEQNPDGDSMACAVLDDNATTEPQVALCEIEDGVTRRLYLVDMTEWPETSFHGSLLASKVASEPQYTAADLDNLLVDFVVNGASVKILRSLGVRQEVALDSGTPTWFGLTGRTIHLVHDQVYNFLGFDPRTAWSTGAGCSHGYVAPRWCILCNHDDTRVVGFADAGRITNSVGFTVYDEYLYGEYCRLTKNRWDDRGTIVDCYKHNCTNPNVQFEARTYGLSEQIFNPTHHGADTNGDGCPDGWTIYCGGDPISEGPPPWGQQNTEFSPAPGETVISDLLVNSAEFAGTDSCAAYAGCPTIASTHTAAWVNKFFPTDPGSGDTDGDGLLDSEEGSDWSSEFWVGRQHWPSPRAFTFMYETEEATLLRMCCRGGGLNPCCSDTDYDGLPDAWEYQHAGILVSAEGLTLSPFNPAEMYTDELKLADKFGAEGFAPKGPYIIGGMDGTYNGDAKTSPNATDAHVGTIRDFDFDHDGLENYQEYLTQIVRVWRYDDVETPLNGRAMKWAEGLPAGITATVDGFFPEMNLWDVATFSQTVQENTIFQDDFTTDNELASALEATGGYDFRALGYMAPCDHAWDPVCQQNTKYQYMRRPSAITGPTVTATSIERRQAAFYITTDPRQWDTDGDGMDDYWEIFHGVNPLLGGAANENTVNIIGGPEKDMVSAAYNGAITYNENLWSMAAGENWHEYDPILAPWMLGLPNADPDGDGLRNLNEAISGNLSSPTTHHTDPTPLWMTDDSKAMSHVSQCYRNMKDAEDASILMSLGWEEDLAYLFSFERTEGYDTDGDWRSDNHEIAGMILPASDPLNAGDPDRRAALYLPGVDACAYSFNEDSLPVSDTYDVFRQFTVECWVKPEGDENTGKTIVERVFVYPASNLQHQESVVRANFRLALDDSGCAYGLFDSDNAAASASPDGSTVRVTAPTALPTGEWSHLALTFDGKHLTLYINGAFVAREFTTLAPANGIRALLQDPTGQYPNSQYATMPGANVFGASRVVTEVGLSRATWDAFNHFFEGYISEVRFWDGARTSAEIQDNYQHRLSQAEITANWNEVYLAWKDGATRNDVDGKATLPAQLLSYYNFQQLPAGQKPEDVTLTPSGFDHAVMANSGWGTDPDDYQILNVGWWSASELKSSVYKDYRFVPWIQNVVGHLPLMDDSFGDSMFWSQFTAGYTPASANGVGSYLIPNGGNPYKGSYSMGDLHSWRVENMSSILASSADYVSRTAFDQRSQFTGLGDLLPLGGAYARLDTDYWDGQGVSTVWTDTQTDTDGDGLPDWWEQLYIELDPNTPDVDKYVERDGESMTATEAYLRDLAAGLQPGASLTYEPNYVNRADMDADGIPDWWQVIYGVTGGATADIDGDGLSNYVEYLLAEYFHLEKFSPNNAFSVNKFVSDYFYQVGNVYVGELFTDHDWITDTWEDLYARDIVSRYLYDALADLDNDRNGDGWSNFAEFQAGTNPKLLSSNGIDGVTLGEYPVPMVEASITYWGNRANVTAPIVVKAWRDAKLETLPDAIWTIGGGAATTATSSDTGTTTSNVVNGVKHLGINPKRQMSLHLSPGHIEAGSVKFSIKDLTFIVYNPQTLDTYYYDSDAATWESLIIDRKVSTEQGVLIEQSTQHEVGTINYTTGEVAVDFTSLPESLVLERNVGDTTDQTRRTLYQTANSYFKVEWRAKPSSSSTTYYLGEADVPSDDNRSLGHLKEGKNTFVAFYDNDGNGKYTAGEPYGAVAGVDVGWNKAKVSIELKDTTPLTARFSLSPNEITVDIPSSSTNDGNGNDLTIEGGSFSTTGGRAANDRDAVFGVNESGNKDASAVAGKPASGDTVLVRVVRATANGLSMASNKWLDTNDANKKKPPFRVVLSKWVDIKNESYITEADFLSRGELDIDWSTLASDWKTAGRDIATDNITNISYLVVLGNQIDLTNIASNNLLNLSFVRKFDSPVHYNETAKPVPMPNNECQTTSPIFSWTIPKKLDTYMAFKVEVSEVVDGAAIPVWTSDFLPLPPSKQVHTDTETVLRYEWQAPFCVGSHFPGHLTKVFENGKTYQWKVAVANALYRNNLTYSEPSSFTMNVGKQNDIGEIRVGVRYFGPVQAQVGDGTSPIRVQAFTSPDFAGVPAGEAYVFDLASVTNAQQAVVANATISGLVPNTTYYVRAFIDTQLDGLRANWESWGYACTRDEPSSSLNVPSPITISAQHGAGILVPVYIEDCDTDHDGLPDAWEWRSSKGLTYMEVTQSIVADSGLLLHEDWAYAITNKVSGTLSSNLAANHLNSPYLAAAVMDIDLTELEDVPADDRPAAAMNCITASVQEAADPLNEETTHVIITDITIVDGQIHIAATSESELTVPASQLYTFDLKAEVVLQVERKASLTDETWEPVGEPQTFTITGGNQTLDIPPVELNNTASGFYRVTLKESNK